MSYEEKVEQFYYTVLPSTVLFDDNLSDHELRIIATLLSFLTIKGEAYPSNKYLGQKLKKSKENISLHINRLIKKGYIVSEYIYDGSEIKKRIIKPTDLLLKSIRGIIEINKGGIIESNKDNNIIDNSIKIIVNTPPEFSEFFDYCKTLSIYHHSMNFQIEAKYNAWKENKWKDGNNKPIKNWKTKIQNTMPYFKKDNNFNGGMKIVKGQNQYTKDEWNILINETCKTGFERTELYNKYKFDKLTNLWLKK